MLAYLFWNRGVEEVGANVAGLFVHLMPVFGIVLAWLFLDEGLAPYHVVGIALILTGIWLTSRYGRRAPRCRGSGRGGDRLNDNDDNIGGSIGDADRVALQQRIVALKMEHRDLDTAIERLAPIRRTTNCNCGG